MSLPPIIDRRYLPQKQEDGSYTRGIGHTGSPWPRGTGHDWCWNPTNCISCGCTWNGPCTAHHNLARIHCWDGTRSDFPWPTEYTEEQWRSHQEEASAAHQRTVEREREGAASGHKW